MKSWTGPILVFGIVFLTMRLMLMIDVYAVNVLYWDQWDFFEAAFEDASLWETFRWQHGPHRQGIGFVVARGVAQISGWDTRVDAFVSGLWVVLACAGFLWLSRRLLGRWSVADLAIPLLVPTLAQYGVFLHTVNASHAAAPLLLLCGVGLSLTVERALPRTAALLFLNFLLIHTGFGLFAAVPITCLFATEVLHAGKARRALPIAALVLSLLVSAAFFAGYTFDPAAPGSSWRSADVGRHAHFVTLMLANVAGVKGVGWLPRRGRRKPAGDQPRCVPPARSAGGPGQGRRHRSSRGPADRLLAALLHRCLGRAHRPGARHGPVEPLRPADRPLLPGHRASRRRAPAESDPHDTSGCNRLGTPGGNLPDARIRGALHEAATRREAALGRDLPGDPRRRGSG